MSTNIVSTTALITGLLSKVHDNSGRREGESFTDIILWLDISQLSSIQYDTNMDSILLYGWIKLNKNSRVYEGEAVVHKQIW